MEKVFCILNNVNCLDEIFEGLICKILNHSGPPTKIKIFALNASSRYIIQSCYVESKAPAPWPHGGAGAASC